jgi:SAM-dependent methyltransferase
MKDVFQKYAEIYDALYSNKDYASETDYLFALLGDLSGKSVLDIGCGTGRYAEEFARRNANVHGIDLSPEMIDVANNRRSVLETPTKKNLTYQVGDARYFKSERSYDVVCSLFHVINYQLTDEELILFFSTAHDALKPGGVLVFDFWFGPGVLSDKPALREKTISQDLLEITRIATPTIFSSNNRVDVKYDVSIKSPQGDFLEKRFSETHSMRYLFESDLQRLSSKFFNVEKLYAWESWSIPNENNWSAVCVMLKI